jgi:Peptidase_C39 like family
MAFIRFRALYAVTVMLVVASALVGMPRPLASAVAVEDPERSIAASVAAVEPSSRPSATTDLITSESDAPTVHGVAAETATATEPTAFWAKTKRETAIWSGWDKDATEFAKIASDLTVQVLEFRGPRAYVYFPGDNKGHKAGEVWIDRADLDDVPWPRWARARRDTVLRAGPELGTEELLPLQRGNYVETTGETRGRWAQAFFLIDRRPAEWAVGWVDSLDLTLPRGEQAEITNYMLTRTALLTSSPELWLNVPYRTQLDGSSYADANCGPTSVAMALDAIGKRDTLESLRAAALQLQDLDGCDHCGTYIQHLASVAETRGAATYGLRDDPRSFHRWTLDEIRQQLRQERVVIPQVKFRLLPGRSKAHYWGDHYIVIVGLAGHNFIYNDPVDSDGRGYGRLISPEALEQAMVGANGDFARAAFAVGR